ncbi:ATPase with role in protein import into the ER [Ceratobasidium sp. UAMH 11750]|nr:ATPase with role in protein import into the ER [Ceratobasidium sp. UAMH 11750]
MILGRLKETAEAYLGCPITHAVITVPAYFNDEQCQATKDAGHIAGLTVLWIINKPMAAAIAYGLDKKGAGESKMIVYDLGGGTFDVSLLRVNNWVFEVLATDGNPHLGEDFDNRIMDYFVDKYQKQTAVNVSKNKRAMSKLKREVEKVKRTLSSQLTTKLEIESFEGGNDFSSILTRAKFQELNYDLFKRTLEPVAKVLQDANLKPKDVDDVILVGGSTRIPLMRQLLKEFFGGSEPRMGINPDEAVAYGAAIQGSVLSGVTPFNDDIVLIDVCPFTLGIKTRGDSLIARNTPIPTRKSEIFTTASDNQHTVLIQILQGDSLLAKDNIVLGNFKLTRIPPAAQGVPQIEVTFEVDMNGILTVVAHDKDSGNLEAITITSERNQLEKTALVRMAQEAQVFTQNDMEARACAAALNDLHRTIAAKRSLHDHSDAQSGPAFMDALDEQSRWAETFGELASTIGLNHRIDRVRDMTYDWVALMAESGVPTAMANTMDPVTTASIPEGSPADSALTEAVLVARTEMPGMSIRGNPTHNPLALRDELSLRTLFSSFAINLCK